MFRSIITRIPKVSVLYRSQYMSKVITQDVKRIRTLSPNSSAKMICKVGCTDVDGIPRICPEETYLEDVEEKTLDICDANSDTSTDTAETGPQPTVALPKSAFSRTPEEKSRMLRLLETLKTKVVEVEGNIGCGKSTLTAHLCKLAAIETEIENYATLHVEKVNHQFLKSFYEEPVRLAFAFQMYMLTTRIFQMDDASRQAKSEDKLVFLDRGAVGDILFALNNHTAGNISDSDLDIYRSVCHERFPETLSDKVDLVIYLDVSPSECWRRMTTVRQREAEAGVPPAYLFDIDSMYFELLVEWLGKRGGKYHDMNIGDAPPLAVIRWESFGCARSVVEMLGSLTEGTRKTPIVSFIEEKEDNYDFVVNTPEEAEEYWNIVNTAILTGENSIVLGNTPLTINQNLRCAFNWDLDRKSCEAYRRLSFWALASESVIHYFGNTAVVKK